MVKFLWTIVFTVHRRCLCI